MGADGTASGVIAVSTPRLEQLARDALVADDVVDQPFGLVAVQHRRTAGWRDVGPDAGPGRRWRGDRGDGEGPAGRRGLRGRETRAGRRQL